MRGQQHDKALRDINLTSLRSIKSNVMPPSSLLIIGTQTLFAIMSHHHQSEESKPAVLVLLATGKLGSGVVDAFLQSTVSGGGFQIYGASRNAKSPKLLSKKGVIPVAFEYGSKSSIARALEISKPTVVVVITHPFYCKEVEHGKLILDACCQENAVPHIILMSSDLADVAPKKAGHISSKKELEVYLGGLAKENSFSILRSGSFMENFDDPSVHNPLCRGRLSDLYEGWVQVNHVASLDVGKAAVAMAKNPKQYKGKTLTCIVSRDTGEELSKVLSDVSDLTCSYQATPPRLILRYVLTDLYHMVDLCRATTKTMDWSKEMNEFKRVVPDAMDFRVWLTTQQKGWSDGTRFGEPAPPKSYFWRVLIVTAAAGAVGTLLYTY